VPAHGLAPQNLSSDKHVDVCVDSGEDRGSTPLASSPEGFRGCRVASRDSVTEHATSAIHSRTCGRPFGLARAYPFFTMTYCGTADSASSFLTGRLVERQFRALPKRLPLALGGSSVSRKFRGKALARARSMSQISTGQSASDRRNCRPKCRGCNENANKVRRNKLLRQLDCVIRCATP